MQIKTATISSKGQVVLPREVRQRLGLKQGDKVQFVLDDQGIKLRPDVSQENPFAAWVGVLSGPPIPGEETTEDFIRATRHEGLSDEELRILRAGPGAQVYQILPDGTEVRVDTKARTTVKP